MTRSLKRTASEENRVEGDGVCLTLGLHFQCVETDPTLTIDVRVVNRGQEAHAWRLEGVPGRDRDPQLEDPSGVGRVLWPDEKCLELGVAARLPRQGHARGRVASQKLHLSAQTTGKHRCHGQDKAVELGIDLNKRGV